MTFFPTTNPAAPLPHNQTGRNSLGTVTHHTLLWCVSAVHMCTRTYITAEACCHRSTMRTSQCNHKEHPAEACCRRSTMHTSQCNDAPQLQPQAHRLPAAVNSYQRPARL
eukprot:scaffold251135_cov21-Tisochrysis_lutea.AAC.1